MNDVHPIFTPLLRRLSRAGTVGAEDAAAEYQNALGVLTDLDEAEMKLLEVRRVLCRAECGGASVEYGVSLDDVLASLRADRRRWEVKVNAYEEDR